MTASTLPETLSADTRRYAAEATRQERGGGRPHESTRELEAAFAQSGDRMPAAGLALGLAISAGLWAVIAALVF